MSNSHTGILCTPLSPATAAAASEDEQRRLAYEAQIQRLNQELDDLKGQIYREKSRWGRE
jgi:hypothetical protein